MPFKLRHCVPEHPTKGGLSSTDEVAISRDDHFSLFFVVLWNVSGFPDEHGEGQNCWSKNDHTFGKVIITF